MEIAVHDAGTVAHGMVFGALLLLGATGAAAASYTLCVYLAVLALLAWITVLIGAYAVYPRYRAHPPGGVTDLTGYPQRLLMLNPATSVWHDLGVERKEHIAWFAPITLTAVACTFARYGAHLRAHRGLRIAVFGLMLLGFGAAGVAGFLGAMLSKYAASAGTWRASGRRSPTSDCIGPGAQRPAKPRQPRASLGRCPPNHPLNRLYERKRATP